MLIYAACGLAGVAILGVIATVVVRSLSSGDEMAVVDASTTQSDSDGANATVASEKDPSSANPADASDDQVAPAASYTVDSPDQLTALDEAERIEQIKATVSHLTEVLKSVSSADAATKAKGLVEHDYQRLEALSVIPGGYQWAPKSGLYKVKMRLTEQDLMAQLERLACIPGVGDSYQTVFGGVVIPCLSCRPPVIWAGDETLRYLALKERFESLLSEMKSIRTAEDAQGASASIESMKKRIDALRKELSSFEQGLTPNEHQIIAKSFRHESTLWDTQLRNGIDRLALLAMATPSPEPSTAVASNVPSAADGDTSTSHNSTPTQTPKSGGTELQISAEFRNFLTVGAELGQLGGKIIEALQNAKDDESAQQAARTLASLTPKFERAMGDATKALLAVQASSTASAEMRRMSYMATKEDTRFAEQVQREFGLPDPPSVTLPDAMQTAAKSSDNSELHNAIRDLRDVLLRGRAPVASLTTRRQIERDLGALGSPLNVR